MTYVRILSLALVPSRWASLIAQLAKNPPAMQETPVWFLGWNSWVGKICWRRDRLPTPVFLDFPCVSADKESACNAGNLGSIPGLGRFPGEGKGYPFQYSGLENSMDCTVHGVTKSQIRLSDFHFHHPDNWHISTLGHDAFVFQTALLLKTQCPVFAEVGCSPCGASDQKGRLLPDER